ncbi:metallophosphoesterase [Pokkaliibacter plantistimulans]|uniref:Metallophosphoesterase n=1 Tax=Pokkaliibacter plantistimulans TaxID=1635171 RepID=A0ABX5LVD2_9GAMM|nr:metallophosphoesterase [Pokkaliibacter plantistimulans]PXF29438.1 metallophosphoesterase [Pokkaliibacter plantistimulans]
MQLQEWQNRIQSALGTLEDDAHRTRVLELIRQSHQQALDIVQSGSTQANSIPWEFVHGLALLDKSAGQDLLPTDSSQFPTRLMDDGTLLGCRKWELLDPKWAEALVQWLEHIWHRHDFITSPASIALPAQVNIAIAGDWGTGDYIAQRVATAMNQLGADVTIHLGDVYYAGVGSDEDNDFSSWPAGHLGQFTLNSNHEMYNGAFGYFTELSKRFPLQKGCSYFSLYNDHWLIIGLDSAYDAKTDNLYMDGALNDSQCQWLSQLAASHAGKRLLLLSHHQGFSMDGSQQTGLYTQVVKALGRVPDYWYWGHLHNVICYAEQQGLKARCIGHGAIPYGRASLLDNKPTVLWQETESASDDGYPLRILNGYLQLQLDGEHIAERLYDERGRLRWSATD